MLEEDSTPPTKQNTYPHRKLDRMSTVIKLLPALQHLNIRILDKEQLEKITDQLVDDIEKLDCLEIPFSSVLLSEFSFK